MRLDVSKCIGRWRGILIQLGVPSDALKDKHGPCPMCGGKDRWRWDNKEGRGTFYCSHCGAGDGFTLLTQYHGWDNRTAFEKVAEIVDAGLVKSEPVQAEVSEAERRKALRELWRASQPVQHGDAVDRYLRSRGIHLDAYPKSLRTAPECPCREAGRKLPAMLGYVTGPDGEPVTLHRTWLGPDGKADLKAPRKLMPGPLPDGSAVRLGEPVNGVLGVAEGIETALAAAQMWRAPVWAALNANQLGKWEPPVGIQRLLIFGDHDAKCDGQRAAFLLAYRMSTRQWGDGPPPAVEVHIPGVSIEHGAAGTDWLDYLKNKEAAA